MPKSIKFFRDKEKAVKYRNKQRKSNYKKGRIHARSGKQRWSAEEIKTLLLFTGSDFELSYKINRSVEAIQIKRCRLVAAQQKEESGGTASNKSITPASKQASAS